MRTFIYLFCFVFVFNLKAQDVHFSQFSVSTMGLNPALVGNQPADFKALKDYALAVKVIVIFKN